MREADAQSLRNKTEQRAIPVKAPGTTLVGNRKAGFVSSIQQCVADAARGILVREFERLAAEPLDGNDRYQDLWQYAANGRIGR